MTFVTNFLSLFRNGRSYQDYFLQDFPLYLPLIRTPSFNYNLFKLLKRLSVWLPKVKPFVKNFEFPYAEEWLEDDFRWEACLKIIMVAIENLSCLSSLLPSKALNSNLFDIMLDSIF